MIENNINMKIMVALFPISQRKATTSSRAKSKPLAHQCNKDASREVACGSGRPKEHEIDSQIFPITVHSLNKCKGVSLNHHKFYKLKRDRTPKSEALSQVVESYS
jgi:hypothetical protein